MIIKANEVTHTNRKKMKNKMCIVRGEKSIHASTKWKNYTHHILNAKYMHNTYI